MNATEAETTPEIQARHEKLREEARTVCGLLREFAGKLAELNEELLGWETGHTLQSPTRAAWFLDRSELLRKPLSKIISRGSGLLQHAALDSLTEDELALRMREIEIHLHHMLRLSHELRENVGLSQWTEEVKKLRLAAGLNAMKGGPLDPN